MSTFTILYFSSATSFTNTASEQLPAPLPLRTLFRLLETKYPGIGPKVLSCSNVSLNLEYMEEEELGSWDASEKDVGQEGVVIQPGDEVAIIPPVSSG